MGSTNNDRRVIALRSDAFRRIREHAVREYPHECCGAILGRRDGDRSEVIAVLELDNVSVEDHRRRFRIAPLDYLRSEREAELQGLTLLGFYHSHPDHPAVPSSTDRAFAQPEFSYPILSVHRGDVTEIASWRIRNVDAEYEREETVIEKREATP